MADPKLDPTRRFIPPDTRPTAAEMTAGLDAIAAAARAIPVTIDDAGGAVASALRFMDATPEELIRAATEPATDTLADIAEAARAFPATIEDALRVLMDATPVELGRSAITLAKLNTPASAAVLSGICRIYEVKNRPDSSTIEDDEDTLADIAEAETAPTAYNPAADSPPLFEMSAGQLSDYSAYLRSAGFTMAADLIAGMADAAAKLGPDHTLVCRVLCTDDITPTQKRIIDTGVALIQTLFDKNADYGDIGLAPPELLPMMSADVGILIRLGDKFVRLRSLMESAAGPRQADESMADTIRDLAGYCLLWLVARAEAEEPEPAPDPSENGE